MAHTTQNHPQKIKENCSNSMNNNKKSVQFILLCFLFLLFAIPMTEEGG